MHLRGFFQVNFPFGQSLIVTVFVVAFLCQAGYVNGNPSGSRSVNRTKKPPWKSGFSLATTLPTSKMLRNSLCCTALAPLITYAMIILQHPDHRDSPILFLGGNLRDLKIKAYFWERIEAPLPPLRPRPKCNFIHPRQLSPFPESLELPFSNDEILSGYQEIVSSGTDQFTAWVKMSPHEDLVQHMVDIHKAIAEFREASEKKLATSSHTLCYPISCAEETQHLQLEPWAPTWKRRCLRKTNCRNVACHYLAGGVRLCRS